MGTLREKKGDLEKKSAKLGPHKGRGENSKGRAHRGGK